ncbi:MAG: ribosome maturation factor RimP [Pseudomonadota bacterium]
MMSMTIGLNKWQKLLNEAFASPVMSMGYQYVGCEYLAQSRRPIIRVYIDKANGITLEDCGAVSQQLNALLSVESLISGMYTLEVSSPGIERLLFTSEQFKTFIGQQISVRLHSSLSGRRNFTGILTSVGNDDITLGLNNETMDIPLSIIAKAKLVTTFKGEQNEH